MLIRFFLNQARFAGAQVGKHDLLLLRKQFGLDLNGLDLKSFVYDF
jgi:hypothetical protein